jgi:hypothetical protein
MNKNKQINRYDSAKRSKTDRSSTGRIRIFYILTLLLIISSVVLRVTGASRRISSGTTTTTAPAGIVHQGRIGSRTLILPNKRQAVSSSENPMAAVTRYAFFTDYQNNQLKSFPHSEQA